MKTITTYILLLVFFDCYCQNTENKIKELEGIWIAEDYYNSFLKTKSAALSKQAFDANDPVALRVNGSEIKNGKLNIGYSTLHDHMLHPEVSEYLISNGDTIREQGCFKINLNIPDSFGYYKTSEIYYFNYEWVSYLNWNTSDSSITLYRPKGKELDERNIKYRRISNSFDEEYPTPNPLYYFTRINTLCGSYTLLDSSGKTLTKNLKFNLNGKITGYDLFNGYTYYFSTDIYCGPAVNHDFILFYEDILKKNSGQFGFAYVVLKNGNIGLYKRIWTTTSFGADVAELSNLLYELQKN